MYRGADDDGEPSIYRESEYMMMVNHQYIENLNIEKVNEILDKLEQQK